MWRLDVMLYVFLGLRVYNVAVSLLDLKCFCKVERDMAISAVCLAVIQLGWSALDRADWADHAGSAGIWMFLAALEGFAWWRLRRTCDHNNKRGKRLKSWAKSHLPKPKVITRIQPQGA